RDQRHRHAASGDQALDEVWPWDERFGELQVAAHRMRHAAKSAGTRRAGTTFRSWGCSRHWGIRTSRGSRHASATGQTPRIACRSLSAKGACTPSYVGRHHCGGAASTHKTPQTAARARPAVGKPAPPSGHAYILAMGESSWQDGATAIAT